MAPVSIEALAYVLPETSTASADLEEALAPLHARLGLPRGWIAGVTGVEERRFWPIGVRPWQRAAQAAERALAEAGLGRESVDVLINTAVSRDVLEPSVASSIHGALGLPASAQNFDVANACLGFLTGLSLASALIGTGQARVALVVAGEGSREVVEATLDRLAQEGTDAATYAENLATLTLGSAAVAAVVVSERASRTGHALLGGVSRAATEHNALCRGDLRGMRTDGARLLGAGVALGGRAWAEAAERFGWSSASLAEYAMHQVGRQHHAAILEALGLPADRALAIYPELGNVGACGVPLTLARAVELGRVRAGDLVALMGIGSGLNCAIHGLRW